MYTVYCFLCFPKPHEQAYAGSPDSVLRAPSIRQLLFSKHIDFEQIQIKVNCLVE